MNESRDVRLKAVFAETLGVYKSRIATILWMSLLLSMPYFLLTVANLSDGAWFVLDLFIGLILDTWTLAALVLLVWPTINPRAGETSSASACLAASARLLFPMVLLVAGIQFAVGFGLGLLIVPGVIIFTIWIGAQPAYVIERIGLMAAWSRSAELTKGLRPKLAWSAILILVLEGISFLPTVISDGTAVTLLSYAASILIYPFTVILMTVIYGRLVGTAESRHTDLQA